jgi:hypothetical protein
VDTTVSIVLSLLSGAGGALILDVWWKPRHARRRAAVLLRAEIQKNRDLIEDALPRGGDRIVIRRDLILPHIALDATIGDLGHFPIDIAEATVSLYHDYARILRAYELQVEAFNDTIGPGEPDDRKRDNFRATSMVLLQLMTRGLRASDGVLAQLEDQAAHSIWPGRRARLLSAPRDLGSPEELPANGEAIRVPGTHREVASTKQGQDDDLMS